MGPQASWSQVLKDPNDAQTICPLTQEVGEDGVMMGVETGEVEDGTGAEPVVREAAFPVVATGAEPVV